MTTHIETRVLRVGIALVTVVLLLPAFALAQDMSSIAGVVKDSSGAVLPGVTVEAASPALIEKVRTVVTDGQGQYKILNLRPGVYTVTFSLPGFNTVRREGIQVTASFTASVNADLRVGALEETITVSGQTPTVDVQNVVQTKVMTRDVIDAIPAGFKNVASLGVLIPGVVTNTQDVGGTSKGTATMAVHGSRQGEQLQRFDGMYYNNGRGPGGGDTAFAPNDATLQEVAIGLGSASAEFAMGGVQGNLIPKDGSNRFNGFFSGSYTDHHLSSYSNLDDTLINQGLTSVDSVDNIWDFDPAFGGPLIKDKLWFYTSARVWQVSYTIGGLYFNKSPVPYVFTPDLGRPSYETDRDKNVSLRLTWQISPRNKVNIHPQYNTSHRDHFYSVGSGTRNTAPEAINDYWARPSAYELVTWSSPVTNRLLLEAGGAFASKDPQGRLQPGVTREMPSYTELSTGFVWGNITAPIGNAAGYNWIEKFTASYVTGSHAAKVGLDLQSGATRGYQDATGNETTLQLLNGLPRQVTVYATPLEYRERMNYNLGLFAQDQWTLKHLTFNLGVRYDHVHSSVPAQHAGPSRWVPTRDLTTAPVDNVPNFKNVSPRFGVAYDLFGDGKTAVKVSVGRYLEGVSTIVFTRRANPLSGTTTSATRPWTDLNGDFVPQESELGVLSNVNFGTTVRNLVVADDVNTTRGYNWEGSASLQHELLPRVSLTAAYFRRQYGNLATTQNTAVTSADFSPYCVMAPVDARLPGGGGYQVCGFSDVSVAKRGVTANVVSLASNFGSQEEVFDGFDFNLNARPGGATVAGGASWGRVRTNNCYATTDLSLTFPGTITGATAPRTSDYCDVRPPFQPNVKFLAVYPLPWWGLAVSGTYQGLPGPQITAARVYTSAEIAPSLGRNLSNGAAGTVTLDLIPPGTSYAPRMNQVDVRVTKSFKVGQALRVQAKVDIYNALNANSILQINSAYGAAWQRPTQILLTRLMKFGVQLDF